MVLVYLVYVCHSGPVRGKSGDGRDLEHMFRVQIRVESVWLRMTDNLLVPVEATIRPSRGTIPIAWETPWKIRMTSSWGQLPRTSRVYTRSCSVFFSGVVVAMMATRGNQTSNRAERAWSFEGSDLPRGLGERT